MLKIRVIFFCIFLLFVFPAGAEEEVPLDAWIVKKPLKQEQSATESEQDLESDDLSNEEREQRELRRRELIEEEREVYKALLEDFDDSDESAVEKRVSTAGRVFKKSVLSRIELKRIEKARIVQKRVRREQDEKARRMIGTKERVPITARLCMGSFSSLGFPSDVARVSKEPGDSVSRVWKNFVREVGVVNCDFVAMTGLVSRTKTKAHEFMTKTASLIKRFDEKNWKYGVSTSEGMGFFAYMYNPAVFQLKEVEEMQSVILRRGGIFEEQHLVNAPIEMVFEDLRATTPQQMRFFIFDFRNFRKLASLPSHPYLLQMTSALNELSAKRSKNEPDERILLFGSIWESRNSPAYQVFSGQLQMEDFLSDAACRFYTSDEMKEEEGVFTCDNDKLERKPQTLFGIVYDFASKTSTGKSSAGQSLKSQKGSQKKNLAKTEITSDIFIHISSLGMQKPQEKNGEPPIGISEIGTSQYPASFKWVDVITENLE